MINKPSTTSYRSAAPASYLLTSLDTFSPARAARLKAPHHACCELQPAAGNDTSRGNQRPLELPRLSPMLRWRCHEDHAHAVVGVVSSGATTAGTNAATGSRSCCDRRRNLLP
uniref:Uncharacterized protein n=1 Tax=Aegilops tauschii subsp. strangulata TaxID=200361 RepID=A0A452ZIT0_AEGTS